MTVLVLVQCTQHPTRYQYPLINYLSLAEKRMIFSYAAACLWAPNPLFWQVLQFQEKLKNEPARIKFMLFSICIEQKGISQYMYQFIAIFLLLN